MWSRYNGCESRPINEPLPTNIASHFPRIIRNHNKIDPTFRSSISAQGAFLSLFLGTSCTRQRREVSQTANFLPVFYFRHLRVRICMSYLRVSGSTFQRKSSAPVYIYICHRIKRKLHKNMFSSVRE